MAASRLQIARASFMFLSLFSLFFLSAGLRGRLATLRHLARPTTLLFITWSALGYSRLWYKTTEWDPFFRVVTPSLNTKQSHNPSLSFLSAGLRGRRSSVIIAV